MTSDAYPPWEPPFAGTETEHVLGSLDRLRATFRWKADGLDADRIHARGGTVLPDGRAVCSSTWPRRRTTPPR